jgi:hypothetical protein
MQNVSDSTGIAPTSLTLVLFGGDWSASRLSGFTHRKILSDTHCVEGWVISKAGLGAMEKIKSLALTENQTSDS